MRNHHAASGIVPQQTFRRELVHGFADRRSTAFQLFGKHQLGDTLPAGKDPFVTCS